MDTPAGLAQSGRGFQLAANQLHRRSGELLAVLPKGETTDEGSFQIIAELFGCSFGAMVLHALSLELVLKALRDKFSVSPLRCHNLLKLFRDLPSEERKASEACYASKLQAHNTRTGGNLSGSLANLLERAADTFVEFRYLSEFKPTEAPFGEMRLAFEALDERLTCSSPKL
jgi:hypothetical protein